MNKERLSEILSTNKTIGDADGNWVKEIIKTYTYFTAANYALSKYYNQNQDFQFQQQLKVTATLSPNRKTLYQYINNGQETNTSGFISDENINKNEALNNTETLEKTIEIEVEKPSDIIPVIDVSETKIITEAVGDNAEISEQNNIEEQQQLVVEEINIESLVSGNSIDISDIETTYINPSKNKNKVDEIINLNDIETIYVSEYEKENAAKNTVNFDEIETIYISEIKYGDATSKTQNYAAQNANENESVEHITINLQKEFHESEDIELVEDESDIETPKSVILPKVNVTEVLMNYDIPEQKENTQIYTPTNNIETENVKHISLQTFKDIVEIVPLENEIDVGIMSSAIRENLEVEEIVIDNEQNKNAINTSEHSFTDWLKQGLYNTPKVVEQTVETVAEIVKTEEQIIEDEKANAIIEKFIETQPKISRPAKTEFYSPVNMAKQSVADNDELATETLANIYILQGNYAKAIKVYEALAAKHPTKKMHFNMLIRKVREKIQAKNKGGLLP